MRKNQFAIQAQEAFRQLVLQPSFPCLGAKAAFNAHTQTVRIFDELGGADSTDELAAALGEFTASVGRDSVGPPVVTSNPSGSTESRPTDYSSFIAIFERPGEMTELEFEQLLWRQLRLLHERDAVRYHWDPQVASNPGDPHFSFSFGGHALYLIGMHANSSRAARRFPWPVMVFNPHEQFERLRSDGKWRRMQESIRQRDLELQGSINPMLSDFGVQSEARQYAGRVVEENWRAPFPKVAGKCPFAH